MKFLRKFNLSLPVIATLFLITTTQASADEENLSPAINQYITQIEAKYNFNHHNLVHLFQSTHANLQIIEKMEHPYEKKSWPTYQGFFISPTRINEGVAFWIKNQKVLKAAEKKYGVPANVITAIIGVETSYGKHAGHYPVMQALTTLAFYYKPRAKFFKRELTQYLLLTREQKLPALKLTGSYAGAIGIPQFMPSTYRHYAVDYSNEGSADLVNVPEDAIFSIANYLKLMGWKHSQPVAIELQKQAPISKKLLSTSAKPRYSVRLLRKYGVHLPATLNPKRKASIISMDMGDENANDYWLTFGNFRAIMRYNPRINYAMAVYQLSEAINNAHRFKTTGKSTETAPTRAIH